MLPQAVNCIACQTQTEEENPRRAERPVEEELLAVPFARTFTPGDGENVAFDGEDAWQAVAQYGTAESPQDLGGMSTVLMKCTPTNHAEWSRRSKMNRLWRKDWTNSCWRHKEKRGPGALFFSFPVSLRSLKPALCGIEVGGIHKFSTVGWPVPVG